MKKLNQSMLSVAGSHVLGVVSSIDPLTTINECVGYLKTVEEETTKRAHIVAKREVLIASIDSEKELLLTYFNQRFAERKIALEHLFQCLTNGVHHQDTKLIDTALAGILGILQDNPLRDLSEFKKNMARPDFVIEL